MGLNVVHVEVEGLDGERLRDFYTALFGWTAGPSQGIDSGYWLLSGDGDAAAVSAAIAEVPEVPSRTWRGRTRAEGHTGGITFFVEVPDVGAALRRAEDLGGERMLGPDQVGPGVEIGRFADPEGHLVGVISGSQALSP